MTHPTSASATQLSQTEAQNLKSSATRQSRRSSNERSASYQATLRLTNRVLNARGDVEGPIEARRPTTDVRRRAKPQTQNIPKAISTSLEGELDDLIADEGRCHGRNERRCRRCRTATVSPHERSGDTRDQRDDEESSGAIKSLGTRWAATRTDNDNNTV